MRTKEPTERQKEKWRTDRARLRALRLVFPVAPKVPMNADEKREHRAYLQRERRAAKLLGTVLL